MISEKLLHFIWLYRYFQHQSLHTVQGEVVEILHPGIWNQDGQGPDFQEARIRIGSTLWVGDVEIHVRSSDWYRHQHAADVHYQKLILHVVYEQDLADEDSLLQRFSCVELKGRISRSMIRQYEAWMQQLQPVVCAGSLTGPADVPQLIWTSWKERLLAERWEEDKGRRIRQWLHHTQEDWEEVAYILTARSFGMNRNADMFEALAVHTPRRLFARNRHIPGATAALLFGQAGLLRGRFRDDYPRYLQQLYAALQYKYRLHPLDPSGWQWKRLRPANFPTIRLAQLAALMEQSVHLFSRWLEASTVEDLRSLLQVKLPDYWQQHYRFDVPVEQTFGHHDSPSGRSLTSAISAIGKDMMDHLILNAIAPLVWWYGKLRLRDDLQQKAMDWMQALPPEHNQIIRMWKQHAIPALHAADSQALYQLYQQYCLHRRCLTCAIGHHLLRKAYATS
ncbi:DUF2851 family protein [Thermoflavifilum thermophilum]|uniref:DUF2851 domain-containing protein n=1 Tax=Thermoflavifilum thermophilum TaxID=1393122 RepID=A0A1I7NI83_9BACT|nr:DUF2851 family protein [Thermoflavifilum thermophilum]SFV34365.1 Protein of unknown function [Thermoflavifilum thermophilum]